MTPQWDIYLTDIGGRILEKVVADESIEYATEWLGAWSRDPEDDQVPVMVPAGSDVGTILAPDMRQTDTSNADSAVATCQTPR